MGTQDPRTVTAARTRHSKSDFTFLSIFIVITRTRCLFDMKANSPEVDFLWNISAKFRRSKKISSSLVYTLHKTWNLAVSRRSQAGTAKKCTEKRDERVELFCLLFWRSPCCHRILRSLLILTNTNVLREHEDKILTTLVYYRCFVSNEGRSTPRAWIPSNRWGINWHLDRELF